MRKNIFNFLVSFLIYLAFTNILDVNFYGGGAILLFILIFMYYSTFDIFENIKKIKNINIYCIILCLILSLSQILGSVVYMYQYDGSVSVFRQLLNIRYIINIIGLFLFFYTILIRYLPRLLDFSLINEKEEGCSKKTFFIVLIFIFLCWLPYYLVLFPGVLTPDSIEQFSHIANGFHIVSDHHPVVHTFLVGVLYSIGNFIFQNPNSATAFVSFTQMIIMASIFSYFICYLKSLKINKFVVLMVLIYFSLSPLHAYYSVTMWKDVLFAGLLLLFVINLLKIDREGFNLYLMCKFIIISLLVLFFRNNAIYMYLFFFPFAIFHYKKNIKKIVLCLIVSLSIFLIVKGPVFSSLNIKKSSSSEYIAIPLQQIGRMAYKGIVFSDTEKELIDKIVDTSYLGELYDPKSCDSIKFSNHYDISYFDNHKFSYLKLWFQLVMKHPSIAVESYLNSTLGYWYVGVDYRVVSDVVMDNDIGIYRSPKLNGIISNYVYGITSKRIPLISTQWSIGLCFVLILCSAFLIFIKKQYYKLFYYVPILGIWITMMIATPVFAEFRYIYGAYTCIPLFLVLPFIFNDKKAN